MLLLCKSWRRSSERTLGLGQAIRSMLWLLGSSGTINIPSDSGPVHLLGQNSFFMDQAIIGAYLLAGAGVLSLLLGSFGEQRRRRAAGAAMWSSSASDHRGLLTRPAHLQGTAQPHHDVVQPHTHGKQSQSVSVTSALHSGTHRKSRSSRLTALD